MPITATQAVHPWREHEITLQAQQNYANGYTDVDVWADFMHENGTAVRRPAFLGWRAHLENSLCFPAGQRKLDVAHGSQRR